MRVLAIDFGTKRIGTAVSDELGIIARPVETITRPSLKESIARLRDLVSELGVDTVVVGLPLRLDNTVGDAAERVLRFAERLGRELGMKILTQDERLTSYEADQMMIERGFNRRKRREKSDEFAAMIILQDFISQTRTNN
ncbi:MAG TPA: Holliday junction resolvase RuvX [Blastocatellia bacterium]|nr:Holliday junction resolvase RuvX [Blastocatellia bacterium]